LESLKLILDSVVDGNGRIHDTLPVHRHCRLTFCISKRDRHSKGETGRAMEGRICKVLLFYVIVATSYVERLNYLSCRLGQEPPPQPVEDSYDGRSLAEVSTWNQTMSVLEDRVY
jgi:hypothetical protein